MNSHGGLEKKKQWMSLWAERSNRYWRGLSDFGWTCNGPGYGMEVWFGNPCLVELDLTVRRLHK